MSAPEPKATHEQVSALQPRPDTLYPLSLDDERIGDARRAQAVQFILERGMEGHTLTLNLYYQPSRGHRPYVAEFLRDGSVYEHHGLTHKDRDGSLDEALDYAVRGWPPF